MNIYVPKEGIECVRLYLDSNKNSKNNKCYLPSVFDSSKYVYSREVFYQKDPRDFISPYSSKERIYYICAKDWNEFYLYDIEGNVILDKFALIHYIADHYFICSSTSIEEICKDEDGCISYYLKSSSLPQIYYKDIFIGEGECTFCNGLMYIRQGDNWRVYDKANFLFMVNESEVGITLFTEEGCRLINESFENIRYDENLIIANCVNGWSIWNLKGSKLIEDEFEEIKIVEDLILAKNTQGWGAWCLDGTNLLPAMHDSITILSNAILYKIDSKDGMISRDGRCILTPKYQYEGICEQTYNSDDDYDYYPFPDKAVFYTLPGYDSESKGGYQCPNHYEMLIQNGRLDEDEVIIENGVVHASYMPKVQDVIYLFLDGEQTLLVTVKGGIICRIPYVAKNRISDELLLVEHDNKLGVYSIKCKSLIIGCNYDRIQFDGNVFLCYRYIDNPEIIEERNPIDKNRITVFQFDQVRNTCSEIYGLGGHKVFNIGYNLYVSVECFGECRLHYVGEKHIEYNRLIDGIGYINNQRWNLYSPPYFINKKILCLPLSYSYTDEVDLPYYDDQSKMNSIVNETMFAVSEKVSERIEHGISISVHNNEYHQNVCTTIIKYALCEYDDNTKELKFKVLPKYDEICPRINGNYDARIGNAWGIVSPEGVEISRIKYKHKVTSTYVEDACTGCVGFLSSDFSTEILPTIYHDIWLKNGIPLAVSMVEKFEQDYEKSYWNSPKWKVRDLYGLLKDGKTLITPYIYTELKVHDGFLLAIVSRYFSEESPYCDRLDIYNCNMDKISSIENVTLYCVQNLPLIRLVKNTDHNRLGREIFYHSLLEGWSTECYNDMYVADSHMFIVGNADYPKYLYGIKNHKGEGTEIEFMFVTKPINGCCFAAKENPNISDEENKLYSVYLFRSKDKDTIERIPVVEDISLEMLYKLVDSDCFYLCSLKYCIDKELKELITQEFRVWADESMSDFENAQSTKDRDGIYWLQSEITKMYTDRNYYDPDDYPHPSSAFEGDGGLYRDWRLG